MEASFSDHSWDSSLQPGSLCWGLSCFAYDQHQEANRLGMANSLISYTPLQQRCMHHHRDPLASGISHEEGCSHHEEEPLMTCGGMREDDNPLLEVPS